MPDTARDDFKKELLRAQVRNPDWTPKDVFEHFEPEHDWLTIDYVERILHDFELPDDDPVFEETEQDVLGQITEDTIETAANGGESEEELPDGVESCPWWECELCGDPFDELRNARRHVLMSKGPHEDREPREPGVLTVHGEQELIELNQRREEGQLAQPFSKEDYAILEGIARHPDATQSEIAESVGVDVDNSDVSKVFGKIDAMWADRGPVMQRLMPHIEPEVEAEDATLRRLPNDADEDEVEMGVPYIATVNNREPYGVFVTLNERRPDVSGLVHEEEMPEGTDSFDFEVGDEVVVKCIKRSGDELGFTMVSWAPDPDSRKVDAPDPNVGRPEQSPERVSTQAGKHSYEGPETGIDTTSGEAAQSITDRPAREPEMNLSDPAVEHATASDAFVHIALSEDEAYELLTGEISEDLRRRVFELATRDD